MLDLLPIASDQNTDEIILYSLGYVFKAAVSFESSTKRFPWEQDLCIHV